MSDASDNVCYSQQIFVPTDHTHTFPASNKTMKTVCEYLSLHLKMQNARIIIVLHSFGLVGNFNLVVYSYLQIKTQIMP